MPTVYSTGGQNTDCAVFGSAAPYWYRIDNPQNLPNGYSTTAPDGTLVNFKLSIDTSGVKKDKYFAWQATGASVYDVGVKGGSDTARYAYTKDKNEVMPPNYSAPPAGWLNVLKPVFSDSGVHATLDNQSKLYNLSNVTFCYGTASVVGGTVFNDANADGVKDGGEAGLPGRTVRLYAGTATATTTTATTDAVGNYSFAAAVGQNYRVCLVVEAGRKQTLSGTAQCNQAPATDERALGYAVSNLSGNVGALNFGEAAIVTIGGTVKDTAGSGLSGRSVRLYAGGVFKATSGPTGDDGAFSFSNQPAGVAYRVCLVAAVGYAQTLPTAATADSDSCTSTSTSPAERGVGYGFTPTTDRTGLEFREVPLVSIGGTVFADANDSGQKDDPAESGLSGRSVRLYAGGVFKATSGPTGDDGAFSFSNQPAGVAYRVCLVAAVGYAQTLPTALTADSDSCTSTSTSPAERGVGYGFTPTANRTGLLFGEVATSKPVDCALTTGNPPDYIVSFTYACKDTSEFVVQYSDTEGNKFASVRPVDTTQPKVPVVEKIIWSFTGGTQKPFTILYDDILPYQLSDALEMKYCNFDPRVVGGDDLTLDSLFDQYPSESGLVLPDGETSCLISKTAFVAGPGIPPPSTPTGKLVVYVYSALDGWRTTP